MTQQETILIIEDNDLNLDIARDLLQRVGFNTLEAEDATTGIALAKVTKPNLILMDMHLPIMNGYEASLIVKNDPELCDIPIVGFTASAMEAEQRKAIEHGCIGVISKPIDVDRFAETVASYLALPAQSAFKPPSQPNMKRETHSGSEQLIFTKNYTVLLVDDNAQNLELLGDILSLMHQPYVSATNGREALYLLKMTKPDLILLDIMMPGMTGYEVLEEIKRDAQTADIPVIFISALNKTEEIIQGLNAGAQDYITKPFIVEEVQARVKAALRIKQYQDALKHQVQEVQRVQKDLEEFLFCASHDLQAPIRKIQQFQDILLKAEPGATLEANRNIIERIGHKAQDMENLLRELLTLTRVHYEKAPFKSISLIEVLTTVLYRWQQQIKDLNATIVVDDLPMVQADYRQMEIVFSALIDNALKFKRDEPPYVHIGAKIVADKLEITVEDNGIGFNEEYTERIFKPFQRLHGVSKYPGTGMGLAIAKKIVTRHQGTIEAKSQLDVGSTFVITLPFVQS